MSLEELRQQAEEEETLEVEETIVEDAEGKQPDIVEETEEDYELELDGEPVPDKPKYSPAETILFKFTKEKKKRQERDSIIEELRAENERLKTESAPKPVESVREVPQAPDMWDSDINGDRAKYNQKVFDYHQQLNEYNNQQQIAQSRQVEAERNNKEQALRLAERAGKFIKESNIPEDKAIDAIQTTVSELDRLTGKEGGGLFLLDRIGEGSDKLAYFLGRNQSELNKVKDWLDQDPTGFTAIVELTKMATTRLKPKNKSTTVTTEPDEPLRGESDSQAASRLQDEYDKAGSDFNALMAIRKKAKSLGVALK